MGIQVRLSEPNPLYNPNRDVAHNFVFVVDTVAGRLEDEVWPELAQLLRQHGVSMEELGKACAAYCEYVAMAKSDPLIPVHESIERSGFKACEPMAQVAVMAMTGMVFSGIQHAAIREATVGGAGPVMQLDELVKSGERVLKYFSRPRWLRAIDYSLRKAGDFTAKLLRR